METTTNIRRVTAIFWLGFFTAISFMETPLKFTAPGISMAQGVAIGHVIFKALNRFEWVFLFIIGITCLIKMPEKSQIRSVGILFTLLFIETVWLLPTLDARALIFLKTGVRGSALLHWLFIIVEIIKIPVLLWIGWPEKSNINETSKT